jgi:hypothetical protein
MNNIQVIWTLAPDMARGLHLRAEVDVGYVGTSSFGIPVGETLEQIEAMPWAMQYVRCSSEMSGICRSNEYVGQCWVDRDDFTPPTTQRKEPGGRASWHPGNRIHQVTGRTLAFTFLQALKEALTEWKEAEGYELPDSAWHLTERYEKVRSNFAKLETIGGSCSGFETQHNAGFLCTVPFKVSVRRYRVPPVVLLIRFLTLSFLQKISRDERNSHLARTLNFRISVP